MEELFELDAIDRDVQLRAQEQRAAGVRLRLLVEHELRRFPVMPYDAAAAAPATCAGGTKSSSGTRGNEGGESMWRTRLALCTAAVLIPSPPTGPVEAAWWRLILGGRSVLYQRQPYTKCTKSRQHCTWLCLILHKVAPNTVQSRA